MGIFLEFLAYFSRILFSYASRNSRNIKATNKPTKV